MPKVLANTLALTNARLLGCHIRNQAQTCCNNSWIQIWICYLSLSRFTNIQRQANGISLLFHCISDYRVIVKLEIWKGRLLSMMGRVKLVKKIILGMLLYSIKIYELHASLSLIGLTFT